MPKQTKYITKRRVGFTLLFLALVGIIVALFIYHPQLMTISFIWAVLSAISVITITAVIIIERKNSAHTFAWLLVLLFLPGVGIFFYLILGRNFRKRKMFSIKELKDREEFIKVYKRLEHAYEDKSLFNLPLSYKISSLLKNNSKAFLSENNSVDIYPDGEKLFPIMFEDLRNAKHHIHLEYFAFANDELGNELGDILIKKVKEGVKVKLIVDDVGSWKFRFRLGRKLSKLGVECYYFNKVRLPFFNSRFNYRNHRKITVIDGTIGYLGGLNIGDKYKGRDTYFGYWRDTHMRMEGGSVHALQTVFLTDLYFISQKNFIKEEELYPKYKVKQELPIQIVTSGPDSSWESIMHVYFTAITNARKSIYMTSPYLILPDGLSMALVTGALSGIDVRIILPGKADHSIVFWGSKSFYLELIEAGVKIYEYQNGFIHAKTMVIDEEICSIGTANMDIRSFLQNFEINGIIYDHDTTVSMKKQFEEDMSKSKLIRLEDVNKLGFFTNLKIGLARMFAPVL